jgi:hypothetical protein
VALIPGKGMRQSISMNRTPPLAKVIFLACALLITLSAISSATPDKKDKPVGRLLFGKVLDPQDNPLPDAVVYVTNTRTRTVKTYIVDYEIYAQYKGRKSDTKSVGQFDDRSQVYLNLKVDTK